MSRRIFLQVTAPTVAIGLLLLGACLVSAWYVNQMQSNLTSIMRENQSSLRAAQQMEITVRQLRFHCFHYLIAPSAELRTLIADDDVRFENWLGVAKQSATNPAEKELVQKIEEGYDRYHDEFDRLANEVMVSGPRRDFQQLVDGHPIKHVVEHCRSLLEDNDQAMNVTVEESGRLSENLRLAMVILGLGGALGGLVSGYGIARGLSRSLYQLSVRVQDMANQFDEEVASVKVTASDGMPGHDGLLDVVRKVEKVTQNIQKQQRELFRAEQLATVGKLAASVAHELRNPLAAMKLLVSVPLRPRNPKPLTEEDLRVIHDEIGRLEQTAQNLLDFARTGAPERRSCDMRDIIQRATDLVRVRAGMQDVEIAMHLPDEPVVAQLDPTQWRTVVVNLFFNALDAMAKGGCLEVKLEQRDGEVVLSVTDTGCGIPASVQDGLFTPFASSKPSGTGLGLSISRRVVEQHGGRITAANRPAAEGTGARFLITLPLAGVQADAQASDHR